MQNRDIFYILSRLDVIENKQRAVTSSIGMLGSIVDQMRRSTYSLSTHTHSAPFDSAAKADANGVGLVAYTSGVNVQTTLVGAITTTSAGVHSGYVMPLLIMNPRSSAAASATNINARFNKDTLSLQFYGVWRDYI